MEFFKELADLKRCILSCFLVWLLFSLFFFTFGLKEVEFLGKNFFLPFPALHSISAQFFEKIQKDLMPAGVELVVLNPLAAFLTKLIISLSLGFIVGLPFFLYRLIKYLSPAFLPSEKKKSIQVVIPSFFLFLAGCFFAYFILIPIILKILYIYPVVLGVTPFFTVNEFIFFVLGLMIVSGIMFLLPIFMLLLSSLGIVEKDFWKSNWRYAVLLFLIFSAIITPDGSGLTMIIMSLPLCGLYFLGYAIIKSEKYAIIKSEKRSKSKNKK